MKAHCGLFDTTRPREQNAGRALPLGRGANLKLRKNNWTRPARGGGRIEASSKRRVKAEERSHCVCDFTYSTARGARAAAAAAGEEVVTPREEEEEEEEAGGEGGEGGEENSREKSEKKEEWGPFGEAGAKRKAQKLPAGLTPGADCFSPPPLPCRSLAGSLGA